MCFVMLPGAQGEREWRLRFLLEHSDLYYDFVGYGYCFYFSIGTHAVLSD